MISDLWRNDHGTSRTSDPSLNGDPDLKLARDDVPRFLVWMRMHMNPSARRDGIVRGRHVLGIKETAFPACSRLLRVEMVRVNEWHMAGHLTRPS